MLYWMTELVYWVGLIVIVGVMGEEEAIPVVGIWLLVSLWHMTAIQVKRWHEREKSGWWVLINFIPVVGWIGAFVENGFLKGTTGANRFDSTPIELKKYKGSGVFFRKGFCEYCWKAARECSGQQSP